MGKIITYASGKEAKTIIWIAKKFCDEHRKAIEWLNAHTDDDTSFFAIEIELWKIGNSDPAPKFSIIEQPNEWAKVVKNKDGIKESTGTELKRLAFWTGLKEYANENNVTIFTQKPSKDHWHTVPIGTSGVWVSLTVLIPNNKITCGFSIADNKELFDSIETIKDEIENEFGYKLIWNRKSDNTKSSKILIEKSNDFTNEDNKIAYQWMMEKAVQFKRIFVKYLSKINV